MAWAPDYLTTAQFKAFVRVPDDDDDVQIGWAISAASRAVDDCTGRQFGQVDDAEERVFTAAYDRRRGRWYARIDDLGSDVGLVVELDGTETIDYVLEPRNAILKGRVFEEIVFGSGVGGCQRDGVAMLTDQWGWPGVPVPIIEATALQASRFLARRNSPYGVTGSPDQGGELRLLSTADPDVKVAVKGYRRWWVGR